MDFGPGGYFLNRLAAWDVSMAGITEFQAEDVAEVEDKSRCDRATNKELASDPLACRPVLNLLPKASFGVRNGGWMLGVAFWGFHENARFCGLPPSAKIRTQNPRTQLQTPHENPLQKSAPQICAKIHPKSAPKSASKLSTNTHTTSQPRGCKGCPLSYTLLPLSQVSESKKLLRDSGGNLTATNTKHGQKHNRTTRANRTRHEYGHRCSCVPLSSEQMLEHRKWGCFDQGCLQQFHAVVFVVPQNAGIDCIKKGVIFEIVPAEKQTTPY